MRDYRSMPKKESELSLLQFASEKLSEKGDSVISGFGIAKGKALFKREHAEHEDLW